MNTLHVRYFATYRAVTGVAEESVETPAHSVRDLFNELVGKYPALAHYNQSMVAVNDQLSGWETELADGDSILFFPRVSGG
jgi:MoaD family protein